MTCSSCRSGCRRRWSPRTPTWTRPGARTRSCAARSSTASSSRTRRPPWTTSCSGRPSCCRSGRSPAPSRRWTPRTPLQGCDHQVLEATLAVVPPATEELYPDVAEIATSADEDRADVRFVPYYLWGNRDVGAMRVWLRGS
ncbi:hypothetical protein [Georgenia sp. SUBG003]|uniref:hypothetical protein n=1 Tax=Georgenia sp. SUBG003 TaxID=1497974 RepID=UPI003AB22F1A